MALKDIRDIIRNFDAYPKTLEDFRIKTYTGAIVTTISTVIIAILFISELNFYLTPEVTEELFVDMSHGDKLRINMDIIFPHISCSLLSVDAMDVSGEQHTNIEHNLYKRRLGLDGKPLEPPVREEKLGKKENEAVKVLQTTLDPQRCESCYGAADDSKCCNTCEEVRIAYRKKGWAFPTDANITQCQREGKLAKLRDEIKEGCQIFGFFEVNRVAGNFHLAPGLSMTHEHLHIHDLDPFSANKINTTHRIRHLSFGRNIPGKTDTLDGTEMVDQWGGTSFNYYIKVVPTMFSRLDGHSFHTNQFAVTRHKRPTQNQIVELGLPGVFISYEIAPMMVKYSEKYKSFFHFATSVCAIIGGIFTIAGMIDSAIYRSSQVLQRKIELGKAS